MNIFNYFNGVIKREGIHFIDVVVVLSESEQMSKPREITVITGGAKGTNAWPHDRRGNLGCVLYAFSLKNHPITPGDGKRWRLCSGHDPTFVDISAVSHPGDLSLGVPRINMVKCNSSDNIFSYG